MGCTQQRLKRSSGRQYFMNARIWQLTGSSRDWDTCFSAMMSAISSTGQLTFKEPANK